MRQANCDQCKRYRWVNSATFEHQGMTVIGEYCAECFDALLIPEAKNPTGRSSGPNHNDPGFDNVIRALEEDR